MGRGTAGAARPHPRGLALLLAAAIGAAACSPGGDVAVAEPGPEQLPQVRDRSHPSDGVGRAWIEPEEAGPPRAVAGLPRDYSLVFAAGPPGIAAGGGVAFQVTPRWSWSRPQLDDAAAPGYTTVRLEGDGGGLEAVAFDPKRIRIRLPGGLRPGERLRIHYGAGAAGAVARWAELGGFRIAVDGNGDGVFRYLPEPVPVRVVAGPATRLAITLPATAHPGDEVIVRVAALDPEGNAAEDFTGDVRLRNVGSASLDVPGRLLLRPGDRGCGRLAGGVRRPGVVRLEAEATGGVRGRADPLEVAEGLPRILWGDVHGHSRYSDGTGSPEDYFRYARDVAGLDVAALTDHDYWGPGRLDLHPEHWREIQRTVRSFHEPGRFVTLLGYEWTNWVYGHRHVLYFEDTGEVFSAVDPRYDTPPRLWEALAGRRALTFAHHSAGAPVPIDWSFAPDPVLEPVTEVSSFHGSSEAPDAPVVVRQAVPGNFVRDALDRGYRLGFIGSGDSHDGHPGAVPSGPPPGGLAAIFSEELTREGVLAALRARRVYATNGPRILLHVSLGGRPMGASLAAPGRSEPLEVRVIAARPLERIDLIRSGSVVESVRPSGSPLEQTLRRSIEGLGAGDYLYVRAVQRDGGAAWSSPFFVDE